MYLFGGDHYRKITPQAVEKALQDMQQYQALLLLETFQKCTQYGLTPQQQPQRLWEVMEYIGLDPHLQNQGANFISNMVEREYT